MVGSDQRSTSARAAPTTPDDFAEWVRPHLPVLANLVARLAPTADRDDVIQETLIRAWSKRHLFDPARGTESSWLLAIGADQATKAHRRVWLAQARAYGAGQAGSIRSDPVDPRSDIDIDLSRALRKLTARQRLAVDCVYFVGLSVVETAAVMKCAEGTVKSTLADARARLRTLLKVNDGFDRP